MWNIFLVDFDAEGNTDNQFSKPHTNENASCFDTRIKHSIEGSDFENDFTRKLSKNPPHLAFLFKYLKMTINELSSKDGFKSTVENLSFSKSRYIPSSCLLIF